MNVCNSGILCRRTGRKTSGRKKGGVIRLLLAESITAASLQESLRRAILLHFRFWIYREMGVTKCGTGCESRRLGEPHDIDNAHHTRTSSLVLPFGGGDFIPVGQYHGPPVPSYGMQERIDEGAPLGPESAAASVPGQAVTLSIISPRDAAPNTVVLVRRYPGSWRAATRGGAQALVIGRPWINY